jgi:hypothetical protein
VRIKTIAFVTASILLNVICAFAQQPAQSPVEQRVPLTEKAVALDSLGVPTLEGTLLTTALNGAPDTPVTNIRLVIKNVSPIFYSYVSGLVTVYDGAGVRCGEGLFKADALAMNESFETDAPGIRVRCTAASWRIVATNLLPRILPGALSIGAAAAPTKLVISVDGEEHPIQLDKPMVLNLGERQRTIVLRQSP